MLDELELLTEQLNSAYRLENKPAVSFAYGRMDELNAFVADNHVEGYLLFHLGYLQSTQLITPTRGFRETHNLTLLLLYPSQLSDKPEQKRIILNALRPFNQDVLRRVDKLGDISNASAKDVQNLTDRNLDGIRLTLSLTTNPVFAC